MKKIGILGVMLVLMTMLMGCGATTYTLQFDNVDKVTVVNKTTGKEVDLTEDQIKTVTENLGKVTFEDATEELGEDYLYELSMASEGSDAVILYIYDDTHMKMNDKFYTATKNTLNLIFYKALFQ